MWNLLNAVKSSDVVECVDAWGETTVKAEDLVVNESGKREVVEEVGEVLPYVCVTVLAEALIVEAVDLGDLTGLVVSSENSDTLWVANLEGDEKGDCLDGVVSTVNIISCMHVSAKTTPPFGVAV